MVSLQSEFWQELDGINFTVQQLNPKELAVEMTKISHLENTVYALDEGIGEIKHLLLEKGKTPDSSSGPVNDSVPSETSSRRPLDVWKTFTHRTTTHGVGTRALSSTP